MSCALQSWQDEAPLLTNVFLQPCPGLHSAKLFSTCWGLWPWCSGTRLRTPHAISHVPSSSTDSVLERQGPKLACIQVWLAHFSSQTPKGWFKVLQVQIKRFLTDVGKFWSSPWERTGLKDMNYNVMLLVSWLFFFLFLRLLFIYEYTYWLLWCFNHYGSTATWWILINIHLNTKEVVYFSAVQTPAIYMSFSWNSVCSAN